MEETMFSFDLAILWLVLASFYIK